MGISVLAWMALTLTLGCGRDKAPRERKLPGVGDVRSGKAARKAPEARPQRLSEVTLTSSGDERTAFLYIPNDLQGPAPIIFGMHGGRGIGDDKGRRMAENWSSEFGRNAVFAFPNATFEAHGSGEMGKTRGRAWYGIEDPPADKMKDVQFIKDLVDHVDKTNPIDRSQIYLSGFSAGGSFVWVAMCEAPEYFAGFAVSSMLPDTVVLDRCDPSVAKPVIYLHGEKDPTSPIEGRDNTPTRNAFRQWMIDDRGCESTPLSTPTKNAGGSKANGETFCRGKKAMELWRLDQQGHCWPTADGCSGHDANKMILDFWGRAGGFPG